MIHVVHLCMYRLTQRCDEFVCFQLIPEIITFNKPILSLAAPTNSPETVFFAVNCLEACTSFPEEGNKQKYEMDFKKQYRLCAEIFRTLLSQTDMEEDNFIWAKVRPYCLIFFYPLRFYDNILQE